MAVSLQPPASSLQPSAAARFWSRALGAVIVLLAPIILLAIAHRLWIRRRALVGLRAKLTGCSAALPRGATLVHGVSLGEVALMKPLLPRLGTGPFILTTTTETGTEGLAKAFPAAPRAHWPFDLPWAVSAFLRRTRPSRVILLEAELWPLALLACRAHGIPVTVLNARMTARSHRRWRLLRPIARRLIGSLSLAVCQEPAYAARLADLGLPRARLAVSGSLKADMVRPAAADAAAAEAARIALPDDPLLLLASTSEPEEAPLLASWKRWGREGGWRCAIVPRHPERGEALVEVCRGMGLEARRTSLQPPASSLQPCDIIIVDEIGRLAPLYALCAQRGGIAVVGGSLGSGRGGQNMLEAAAAGCCTVVGWDTVAQPDPMRLLRGAQAVVELSAPTLDADLAVLATDPSRRADLGQRAQAAWLSGKGALDRTIRILEQPPASSPQPPAYL
jgi:3-deoxy-D-manno-octulosonic-acid transferase